jgi:hypothetical protein
MYVSLPVIGTRMALGRPSPSLPPTSLGWEMVLVQILKSKKEKAIRCNTLSSGWLLCYGIVHLMGLTL